MLDMLGSNAELCFMLYADWLSVKNDHSHYRNVTSCPRLTSIRI